MSALTPAQQTALAQIASSSSEHIIGVDEVGMGCLAGPVTVAAAVFPAGWAHVRVKDSKLLTSKAREAADLIVRKEALAFCIESAPSTEIDEHGIHKTHAMLVEKVVLQCLSWFPAALIVQDGVLPVTIGGGPQNMVWLSKADVHVPAVSAASILAKVYRDAFMLKMSWEYPGYNFGTNMGYGTREHLDALREIGVCPLHRRSYKPVRRLC